MSVVTLPTGFGHQLYLIGGDRLVKLDKVRAAPNQWKSGPNGRVTITFNNSSQFTLIEGNRPPGIIFKKVTSDTTGLTFSQAKRLTSSQDKKPDSETTSQGVSPIKYGKFRGPTGNLWMVTSHFDGSPGGILLTQSLTGSGSSAKRVSWSTPAEKIKRLSVRGTELFYLGRSNGTWDKYTRVG
jgi:hypothetical protein